MYMNYYTLYKGTCNDFQELAIINENTYFANMNYMYHVYMYYYGFEQSITYTVMQI